VAKIKIGKIICYLHLSVLKIIKRISNIIVWTILGLYILVFGASRLTVVQEYMGTRMARFLSHKLGTSVSIERMDIGLLNHLTLDNLHVKDQESKDMLWCSKLSARLELLPLTEGKIALAKAQMFGAHARLYQKTANDKLNCQFVLDSLASKDTTSTTPLDLRINSLILRHTSVSYDCLDAPKTPGKLNPKHLWLKDISTHIVLKTLTEDSLNIRVKRLSMKEKSGLVLDRLSFRFVGGRSKSLLTDFMLRMPGTNIQLDNVEATYRFRGDHFVVPSLQYMGGIKPSTITLSDLACFLPSLKTFNSTLSINADFNGQGETLSLPKLMISSTTGDIGLNMTGWAKDLRQKEPAWLVDIQHLDLSGKTINFISENLKGERAQVPDIINRMGGIHLKGATSGVGLGNITTNNQLNTDAGNISISLKMDSQRKFKGDVKTDGIDLKRLLDNEHFGRLATQIALSGQLPENGNVQIDAEGLINTFEYQGYQYKNIELNGHYSKQDIHGTLNIDDPNVTLSIEGQVRQQGNSNNVQLTALVGNLSPKLTNLTDKWDDARFSGQLNANFTASSVNDIVGTIEMSDFFMTSPSEYYALDKVSIESNFTEEIHHITLDSDFGNIEITGDFDYKTLPQSFTNFIAAKLPTLPGIPKLNPNTKNNFVIAATINKTDWVQHLLQLPVILEQPLHLQGMVNDPMHSIELECEIPRIVYKESGYANGLINITSPGDTLQYNLSVTKLMDDGDHFDLKAVGNAMNNNLFTSFMWDNHSEDRMSGELNATVSFDASHDNKQMAYISIEPSQMNVRNQLWDIEPSFISYSKNNVGFNNFAIRNDKQFLTIQGVASEHSEDSLVIQMRGIDIDYVLDLVNFHAVDFNGYATGGGVVRGVFGAMEADAKLSVKDFKFEHGRMGTLNANASWNKEKEQIEIQAIADDGKDAMTYIDGYVSPEQNYIDLAIRAEGTHLDFAQSFTSSFLSSVTGHGHGAVRLVGPLDAINLTGELTLNGQVHVSTLGCDYELRNDTIRMVPNEIEFVNCHIYDINNHVGILTGGIHHKELTQMTYDIYIKAQELLAFDFKDFSRPVLERAKQQSRADSEHSETEQSEDTFYGTVYANGNVSIQGREGSVTIEADVTPLANSVFVYNAASTDAVNSQEFIQWNKGDAQSEQSQNNKEEEEDDFRSDLTMRLKINASPNATIRLLMDPRTNDYITLRGNGELSTTYYNKGGFQMFGTYRITEGTYGLTIQNIIKKNFIFNEGGTVVFGGDPYDASLNMQAQHTVNGVSLSDLNVGNSFSNTVRVNCLMNITGQPRSPIIDFDLDIPNVNSDEKQMVRSIINGQEEMNQQVIYLLAVGRFYPQGANNASEDNTGRSKTSLAMQSLLSGTLSGQINNMLGQVIKSNKWNFGANISTGDEGWNNAEYEGLISGRLLNNRLLVNGQFGYRDNAKTANPSFIGDFDIRYLLFPNGNMALKVYNQTNDRYFTKSSLNTQGLGIILKKDFDGIRDLFGIKKKKARKEEEKK
jgi:hypothetical protein